MKKAIGLTFRHRIHLRQMGGLWLPDARAWLIPAVSVANAAMLPGIVLVDPDESEIATFYTTQLPR